MTPREVGAEDRGEEDDFRVMFVSEHPRLVALGVALTHDRGVAEEVAQEALLRAYRDWSRVARLDRPGAWVRRVALNLIADRGRRAATERRAQHRWGSRRDGIEDPVFDAEFWSAVAELPERQRSAVALFYVLDRSVDEVAATMGIRSGTVHRMLHDARESPPRGAGRGW
jgi:RNA polymerase sigma-70 factor (ECF subfamily)